MAKIALILGTARERANGKGIAAWLLEQLKKNNTIPECEYIALGPGDEPFPAGNVTEPTIAAAIKESSQYASTESQKWSKFVNSCSGFVFLSPQYNWGYPGVLKNAIDHIFHEWAGKPALIVTYGGHGGTKAAEQLKQVLENGCKMKVATKTVAISVPGGYIGGTQRVGQGLSAEDPKPVEDEFLNGYEGTVQEAQKELLGLISK